MKLKLQALGISKRTILLHKRASQRRLLRSDYEIKHRTLYGYKQATAVFMGPSVDLRIKPPDAGIPMLRTKFEVKAAEHNYDHTVTPGSIRHTSMV